MTLFVHDGENIPTAPSKDPEETLSYGWDFTAELEDGETITNSVWELPEDLTEVSSSNAAGITEVKVSGGKVDNEYTIKNTITTTEKIMVRRLTIPCKLL